MTKTSSLRLMIAASTALFLYGTIAPMLGTLLPDLSARFHMTPRQNGSIAAVQALGLVLASIVAGPLIDSRGKKAGFLWGMTLIVVSLFTLPNASGWKIIMGCMFILGMGGGTIVTAANTLVSDIGEDKRASMLSFANVFFGLGGLVTPLIAANVFHDNAIGLSYLLAALALAMLIMDATTPMPAPVPSTDLSPTRQLQDKSLLFLLSLFVFLYVACEVAFWNWLTKYLISEGISKSLALNILALGFASGMLVGRLISFRILTKFSAVSVSLVCSGLMMITTYWTLHAPNPTVAWLSVFAAGAVMGPVYPSAIGIVGDAFPQRSATFIGIAITAGWLGVVASSWLIGLIAGNNGDHLRLALLLLPVFSAVMMIVNLGMRPMLAMARARKRVS
ncbi:MAG TPA: MFS transporter [Terriglobales bacterium]|jgi:fucose permease|nr:MFS transporter [Terriglobales bacterium]